MKNHKSKNGKLIHCFTDYEIVVFFSEEDKIEKLLELTGIMNENNQLDIQINNYPKLTENIESILTYFEKENNCNLIRDQLNEKWIIRELNKILLETFDQNELIDNFWKKYFVIST